ncbi:MAG: histone H1 [Sulfuricurvum sp. PC08-66]|nr:MAG: histone H1 [Sulfuricurvum sp. PC08-66]
MNSTELYDKIIELGNAFAKDGAEFKEKGNKAAGARARKASLEMGKLFGEYRKATINETKK